MFAVAQGTHAVYIPLQITELWYVVKYDVLAKKILLVESSIIAPDLELPSIAVRLNRLFGVKLGV